MSIKLYHASNVLQDVLLVLMLRPVNHANLNLSYRTTLAYLALQNHFIMLLLHHVDLVL